MQEVLVGRLRLPLVAGLRLAEDCSSPTLDPAWEHDLTLVIFKKHRDGDAINK